MDLVLVKNSKFKKSSGVATIIVPITLDSQLIWETKETEEIRWANNRDSIVERNRISIEYYPGFAVQLLRLCSIVFDYIRLRSIDSIVFDWPAPHACLCKQKIGSLKSRSTEKLTKVYLTL